MKILLIINGDFVNYLDNNFLKNYDKVVCVDGGLNNFAKIKTDIIPDYLIGDFDSINVELLNKYKTKSIIIKKDNQDESDLVFAIKYLINELNNINVIDIACSTGNRIDHTLCNILALRFINKNIKTSILGQNCRIYLLNNNSYNINVNVNSTISLIPITNIANINTDGLQWELKNVSLDFGFINGISNIALKNVINIDISNGECLFIINNSI